MTESERRAEVARGYEHFKSLVDADKPREDNTVFRELMGELGAINKAVQTQVAPIVKAGGHRDTAAMQELLFKLYLEQATKQPLINLEHFFAWMLTGTAMEGLYPKELGVSPKMPT